MPLKIDMFTETFTSRDDLRVSRAREISVQLAIVADDLTGALDVSAPFAMRGLRVVVATTPIGTAEAIASGADVVAVNTASREISAEVAAGTVAGVVRELVMARPVRVLKKIDSRLKGHVATEVRAMMDALGCARAVVAPAVPAQGRVVSGGFVRGSGVAYPLNIGSIMGDIPHEAPDTLDGEDLRAVAEGAPRDALLVGASGLGVALAELLAASDLRSTPTVRGPLLVVVGSRDPITLRQVDVALSGARLAHVVSRDGLIDNPAGGPALVQAVVPAGPAFDASMERFGRSVAALLLTGTYLTVLLTGGETAQTVLGALGVGSLEVLGELLPGMPVTRASVGDRSLTILTKSGGFGTPQDILRLAEIAQGAVTVTDHAYAGDA